MYIYVTTPRVVYNLVSVIVNIRPERARAYALVSCFIRNFAYEYFNLNTA